MTRPVRLQLSRARGFNLQAHSLATNGLLAASCARPGVFGNPFRVQTAAEVYDCRTESAHQHVVTWFRDWLSKPNDTFVTDGSDYFAALYTRADFSCADFEERK